MYKKNHISIVQLNLDARNCTASSWHESIYLLSYSIYTQGCEGSNFSCYQNCYLLETPIHLVTQLTVPNNYSYSTCSIYYTAYPDVIFSSGLHSNFINVMSGYHFPFFVRCVEYYKKYVPCAHQVEDTYQLPFYFLSPANLSFLQMSNHR